MQAALHAAVADQAPSTAVQRSPEGPLAGRDVPAPGPSASRTKTYRPELLRAVHYEATRAWPRPATGAGPDPGRKRFKNTPLSTAGARGYMQVMRSDEADRQPETNLFHIRTNLRFGCTILRHYLDIEKGDLFRALDRYNGSLGRAEYPNLVRGAWERNWGYPSRSGLAQNP